MTLILCIETSATICSVALSQEGATRACLCEKAPNSHSVVLTTLIDKILKDCSISMQNINAVAVSSGPGSYTGLRIGVSVAKGLCYGSGKPLISIPSLEIIASGILKNQLLPGEETLICPMMDARRMEVYSALYNTRLEMVRSTMAEVIEVNSYSEILQNKIVLFVGNGAAKCRGIIRHPNALFDSEVDASASEMSTLSHQKFLSGQFEDLAYFEPFYLKNFIATTPKKRL